MEKEASAEKLLVALSRELEKAIKFEDDNNRTQEYKCLQQDNNNLMRDKKALEDQLASLKASRDDALKQKECLLEQLLEFRDDRDRYVKETHDLKAEVLKHVAESDLKTKDLEVDFVAYMTGDCRLSASFEDVKQFTSTASSFDIELSVGGFDHRLIFRTTQGKEIGICMKDAIMHHCKELAKKKSGADEVPLDESRLPFTSVNKTQGGGATSETASVEGLDCGNVWY